MNAVNPRFAAASFRQRALAQRGKPLEHAWRDHGDHALNPDLFAYYEDLDMRSAAVLVPVVDYGDEARVIFTRRTTKLRKHSGQIAFPGGSIDPDDRSPEDAALRECEEEIGLDRHFVQPVARLPDYLAGTGFRITPVLSVVRPGFSLSANPDEVDHIFEVPLGFIMDPLNHQHRSGVLGGMTRHYYEINYGVYRIWGITAGIVRTIYERLYA
ncbi:CoA pyrophosphatase [Martelella lutilitoris]|uniref:CoA pyrophosphatase n=1 Tax=Martelella lutilitoris TaxID=2583532 RepID=A0A7T7KLX6_9HYPH|nr:CoA pyrophosphatase [Martelella lutilitoris]QQM31206.1 CoA pyrophosphatase [Martelella lutilitoris]